MRKIKSDNLVIGKNVIIEPNSAIRGLIGNTKNIIIGDNILYSQ
jgi:hypothetical protein